MYKYQLMPPKLSQQLPVTAGVVPAGGPSTMSPKLAPNTNATITPTASPIAGGLLGTNSTMHPTMAPAAAAASNTLLPISTTCNIAAVKAGMCNFALYCTNGNVYQPPGMRKFGCLMMPQGKFVKYNLTNWCFESVDDCIGQASLPNSSAANGYCTLAQLT